MGLIPGRSRTGAGKILSYFNAFYINSKGGEFKRSEAIRQLKKIRKFHDQAYNEHGDKRDTWIQDALATLVNMKVLSRRRPGLYEWNKAPGVEESRAFNYYFKKYHKYGNANTKPRKENTKPEQTKLNITPNSEGSSLKQLGSNKTTYKYDEPSVKILETFDNKDQEQIYLVSFIQTRDEFSSLCPVTGQPDQAKIEILYVPNKKMVESKSLKLYFFAFRNYGSFHENIINKITKDLWQLLTPKYLRIFGDFSPRGGIAIKPLVEKWAEPDLHLSTSVIQQIQRLVNSWDRKNAVL